MYRAAEITKNQGEKYFIIIDDSNIQTNYTISSPQTTYTSGSASIIEIPPTAHQRLLLTEAKPLLFQEVGTI